MTPGRSEAALAPDPVAFRALEHAGWQGAARHYDDAFGSLTRQAVDPLLDSAEVRSGARTLDVASGPGYAAAAAAARGARVAALDFSSAMVELARSQNPEIEFREGDAEALPFPDGSFDTVVTTLVLCSVENPETTLKQIRRVLAPGGSYLLMEHGVATDAKVQKWQHRINGFNRMVLGGCNLNRPIRQMVTANGWKRFTTATKSASSCSVCFCSFQWLQ